MDLLWPGFIALLVIIPLITALYIWALRRRRPFAVRYSSLSLVRVALPHTSWLRRHLPFILFLLALGSLVFALARPVTITAVPTDQTTIMLAIDVSLSMRSRDVTPSRIEAAEAAALSFIQRQKSTTQIGLVAFSNFAEIIQPPTTDQEALQSAVESLTLGRRTAIGDGILKSLEAIADIDKNVAPLVTDPSAPQPAPVPPGAYAPDIIVLLTDGVSNTGPTPIEAAKLAADRGVRIYTIGFGTEAGDPGFGGRQFPGGNDPFGGGGGNLQGQNGGGNFRGFFRRGIDEQTLKDVAAMTDGSYHAASSASELQSVFQSLPTYLIMKHEISEITVVFAAVGALLAASSIILAMYWHPLS